MAGWRRRLAFQLGGSGIVVVVAAIVAARGFAQHASPPATSAPPPPVPVLTATAARSNVPVYLEGIGTVQAKYSVTESARVTGQIMQVPVREGQMVKQGDLIAVIDPRPYQAALDQAMAKKQEDQAQLANARLDLARFEPLAREGFATQQQLDTQKALVDQLVATIAADQASIETAQLNLVYCYITSPIPGRVSLRLIDPGNLAQPNTTGIITVTQVQPITATFTLPQEQLGQVTSAMAKGPVPVLAYSSDDSTELDTGTLITPNSMIDQTTGTITLKAEFPNPRNALWPGQFINAHLQVGIDRNAVTVPPAAIEHGPDGLYVYVVKPDRTVAVQPIAVGYQTARLAVVTKGLSGGAQIVVQGQSRLDTGTRVSTKSVAATS
jgi:membrane fusion protein, multidrug efflux system